MGEVVDDGDAACSADGFQPTLQSAEARQRRDRVGQRQAKGMDRSERRQRVHGIMPPGHGERHGMMLARGVEREPRSVGSQFKPAPRQRCTMGVEAEADQGGGV